MPESTEEGSYDAVRMVMKEKNVLNNIFKISDMVGRCPPVR